MRSRFRGLLSSRWTEQTTEHHRKAKVGPQMTAVNTGRCSAGKCGAGFTAAPAKQPRFIKDKNFQSGPFSGGIQSYRSYQIGTQKDGQSCKVKFSQNSTDRKFDHLWRARTHTGEKPFSQRHSTSCPWFNRCSTVWNNVNKHSIPWTQ